MRKYILLLLIAMLPVFCSSAFSISQAYSGESAGCKQLNSTGTICQDGLPVVISFVISMQQYPYYYYGNFTAHTIWGDGVTSPTNIYGAPCKVSDTSPSQCFVTLKPFPITSLNGTSTRNITITLVSQDYPQVNFTGNLSVSIQHYANSSGYATANLYNSTYTEYTTISSSYYYFCATYQICNQTITDSLYSAKSYLDNATSNINSEQTAAAYLNATDAEYSLLQINQTYPAFEEMANLIVSNFLSARSAIRNSTILYDQFSIALSRCNSTYASDAGSEIKNISSHPIINSVNMSDWYLAQADALQSNITNNVDVCNGVTKSASASLSTGKASGTSLLSSKILLFPTTYLLILPAIVLVIISVLKVRDMREVKKIREESNMHDKAKQHQNGNNPMLPQAENPDSQQPKTEDKSPASKPG